MGHCRENHWQFINPDRPRQSSRGSNLLKSLGLCDMVGKMVPSLERQFLQLAAGITDKLDSGELREARPT